MREAIERLCRPENLQLLLDHFKDLGPLAAVLLTMLESLLPPLPLVAIVAWNVLSHGVFMGALLSWIGTCLGCTLVFLFYRWLFRVFRRHAKKQHEKLEKARAWVKSINAITLFAIAMMPFTPSAFLNFAFGASDYPIGKYLPTLYGAKLVMISLMAAFGKSVEKALDEPLFIILAIALIVALYLISRYVTKKYHVNER